MDALPSWPWGQGGLSKCAVLDQEAAADTKAVALPDKRPRFCETALQGFSAHEFTPFQADGAGRVGLLTEPQQADLGGQCSDGR